MFVVLGIDPGVSRCGYGCLAGGVGMQAKVVAAGVITTPPSDPLPTRLAALYADLVALVTELGPDAVAVERVFFQVNARTAMSVGQASGLALAIAAGAGCEVAQYTPNEVKQAVAGYGSASKEQVQRMVQSLLGLAERPSPPDTADALALALCHLASAPLRARLPPGVPDKPPVPAKARASAVGIPMIGSLRGTIVHRSARGEMLLEVGGVGYRVTVPPSALAGLGELGGTAMVHTHLNVREDSLTLYGFASRDERDCFEALIGAHGVGPAMALAILSVHVPAQLRQVLADGDLDALCLVPGVGRKTAARLLIELRSRLDLPDDDMAAAANGHGNGSVSTRADLRAALGALGYEADEVHHALRQLPAEGAVDDLLRGALRLLGANR